MPVVTVTPTTGGSPQSMQVPEGLHKSDDPTRTARIRELLVEDLDQRWEAAIAAIIAALRDSEVLDETASTYTRLRTLREIAREQINEHVLEPTSIAAVKRGDHWTSSYIADAFERGSERVESLLLAVGYDEATVQQALSSSRERQRLERSERADLYQSLLELRQATVTAIVEQTRRVINDVEDGEDQPADAAVPAIVPGTIQEVIRNRGDKVGQTRSHTAAITAIVAAVNAFAIHAYRRAGVEFVGASPERSTRAQRARNDRRHRDDQRGQRGQHVRKIGVDIELSESARGVDQLVPGAGTTESPVPGQTPSNETVEYGMWKTARDNRVCALCKPLHGRVYRLDAVADGRAPRPPLHPNCRCLVIPLRTVVA